MVSCGDAQTHEDSGVRRRSDARKRCAEMLRRTKTVVCGDAQTHEDGGVRRCSDAHGGDAQTHKGGDAQTHKGGDTQTHEDGGVRRRMKTVAYGNAERRWHTEMQRCTETRPWHMETQKDSRGSAAAKAVAASPQLRSSVLQAE
jgi:hypothetical protein